MNQQPITTYATSAGKPRIFAFIHDKSVGKKTYINGLLAATSFNTENLTGITSLKIGRVIKDGARCTGGTVSNSGCQLTCTVPKTTGITTTTVSDGSGSLTCDTSSHFAGSIPYTCSSGVFSSSGSCSGAGCVLYTTLLGRNISFNCDCRSWTK